MNEKEAREILKKVRKGKNCFDIHGSFRYGEAKGYLERIAQEKEIFGPVIRALYPGHDKKDSACVQCTPGGRTVVKNFLCAYHKAVKFLSGNFSWT